MMKLREYRTEDAHYICSWITDEISFYEWSAGMLGDYPVDPDAFDAKIKASIAAGRFMALTYADENDMPAGYMIIRYPDETDDTLLRFGFVIIDPMLRGCGIGHELLEAACGYSRTVLKAQRTSLAVFTRNRKAMRCYAAAGFLQTGDMELYQVPPGEWESVVMEKTLKGSTV